jgi:hypothetical protein
VELFAIPMRQHTLRGELCYEPFAGSGSQIIAAEKLGRRCFAIEISPRYCDVIVRRWISFVGKDNTPGKLLSRYGSGNWSAKAAMASRFNRYRQCATVTAKKYSARNAICHSHVASTPQATGGLGREQTALSTLQAGGSLELGARRESW